MTTTALHDVRIAAVLDILHRAGARRVLDLGCGDGALLLRLAAEATEVVGVDRCAAALARLRDLLRRQSPALQARVRLVHASLADTGTGFAGFDAAIMVETIEHIAPERLSTVERAVFHRLVPGLVVITTPNGDYNGLLGVPSHRFRHPDHRFEWSRARFATWCAGVASRAGYGVSHRDIGGAHPDLGGPSQMAVFTRHAA